MADIKQFYSNYEGFSLKSEFADTFFLKESPGGWSDDTIEFKRHKDYHGIFYSFTNDLLFYGDAMDYIEDAFQLGGINTILRLTKYKLRDVDGDVKWVEEYTAIADFQTRVIEKNHLSINFNSNQLEEIIKSHERDTFEIERETSIDDKILPPFNTDKISISGRTLITGGESVADLGYGAYTGTVNGDDFQGLYVRDYEYISVVTQKVTEGHERHSSVDRQNATNNIDEAIRMFVGDVTAIEPDLTVDINYDLEFYINNAYNSTVKAYLRVLEHNGTSYFEYERFEIFSQTLSGSNTDSKHTLKGSKTITIPYNRGIQLVFRATGTPGSIPVKVTKQNLKVFFTEFFESSPDLKFAFIHDVADRLMTILTGEKDRFYSKYFGREELKYKKDGEGGLIGLISGFWVRAFDSSSDKYKSLQISLNDLIKSVQATFNIGIGIETHNLKQRLRFEPLTYFYRDEVVVRLPYQLNNVKRTVDKDLFFSGVEIGHEKGGEYENEIGLDEPNTITEMVTPIRKTKNKFVRKSKIRSDDYGMEIVRRKPQFSYPEEDVSGDEDNWYLDLKRDTVGFLQKTWQDRLTRIPTQINSPNDYKSMFFTPLRMLFRHGFVLRAGMELYTDKLIKYSSSKANTKLTMEFSGDGRAYAENSDIPVSALDRARFLPEIIECEHPVDDDLYDLITGVTKIKYGGEYENIPNFYFKFEFINENGNKERGYLLDFNPKGTGKFKFQKANENLII